MEERHALNQLGKDMQTDQKQKKKRTRTEEIVQQNSSLTDQTGS